VRIVGLVCAYDEQPAWLAELVASLARAGCDHVVFCDGAYDLYPDAKGNSGSIAAHIVASTALGAGIGCTIHQPQWPWPGNEVEKRTALFALGHLIAEPGTDWLLVADADEVWGQAPGLRDALEATDLDVADVTLWEAGEHGSQFPIRKLFRAHPAGITVEGYHGRYVDGAGRVLWDNGRPKEEEPALICWDVRVQHRPGDRALARDMSRREYYGLRDDVGAEHVGA
jgi:hypothetical protein